MSNFLSGISITLSAIALAVSGWTAYQLSQLNLLIDQQQNTITEQQNTNTQQQDKITQLTQKIEQNKALISSDTTQQLNSVSTTSKAQNNVIQPGQFVRQGFDNKIKIELQSVKRIQNPDSEEKNVVVVQMRIRRIVPKGKVDAISLNQSRGRNPETSEVYRTIQNKSTSFTYINDLPQDSWGNAYFWLKVPEGINVIDIVIPETAIFEAVPISS
ncbi:hypothetical protein [Pleurocapsa sp. PCC 7319]|uniref:hypothetical protein n=1 Tax=Pleurocapsa sp. PCC 7319 TaxID=118161 RepID=UPI00034D66A5|nr:hypothetical protein [Pleurocapsa sp. PCC 7319]